MIQSQPIESKPRLGDTKCATVSILELTIILLSPELFGLHVLSVPQ